MATPNEETPLQDEKEEGGLGGCLCCRTVAPIEIGFLAKYPRRVLLLAHYLCAFSLILMVIGFVGAYSNGHILEYFSWISVHGPAGMGFAGVRNVCTKKEGDLKCVSWSEFDCGASNIDTGTCEQCKTTSMSLVVSVCIGLFTYYSFYKKTDARMNGDDSNCTKFMACFSAFFGGTNFGLALLAYWQTCVLVADKIPETSVHAGAGCWCITVATILKIFMGILHLGLPVKHAKSSNV